MIPALEDYFDRLQKLHQEIQKTIADLPQAALDWAPPGPEMNSLGVIAVHIAGSQRYWIGDVAGQDPSNRDRPAEFRTRGLDAATLRSRLNAALDHSRGVLERLTLADLEAERIAPSDGRQVRVAWVLSHSLSHTAEHLGHMGITRRWWQQQGKV
jgi:uncharacterized damage-inducible protein DinB